MPVGRVSTTVVVPKVVAFPVLLTAIVYVPLPPTGKLPLCDFVMASVGCARVVGSVAVGVLTAPPPLAVAEFVTLPGVVPVGIVTPRVIDGKAAEAAMVAVDVQVTTCAESEHVQPVPVADAYVSPVGSVSTTVVVPNVVALPVLLTAIVYEPLPPTTKFPTCDLAIASTGIVTVVTSVALPLFGAPPPDELAVLVTVGTADAATDTTTEIGFPMPDALIVVLLVHVIVPAALAHDQPVPPALTYVSPAGKVSTMVYVPDVAA